MAESSGDKQYDATPHRRQKAREEGQVARSQDLSSAIVLLGSLLVLMYLGGDFLVFLRNLMERFLGGEAWRSTDTPTMIALFHEIVGMLGSQLLPILVAIFAIAVAGQMGQFGFLWLPDKLSIDFERLNLVQGIQRLFSSQNIMRLGFGFAKVVMVAALGAWILWGLMPTVIATSSMAMGDVATFFGSSTLNSAVKLAAALLVLAGLDYFYQRWKFEQDLKMSHQEMREEMREMQGDPEVIKQRKALQRQLVMSRLKTVVPTAEAIVTNPTELAIAIRYDIDTMAAPVVVAKGAGVLAQRIRRLGLEHGIPIVERKDLAQALYKHVDVGQPIPTEQYAAVAEVLRYVYQLKGKTITPEQAARVATR